MVIIRNFIIWLKCFLPFMGLVAIYYLLILLITILFNYYNSNLSPGSVNPFYLLVRWDSFHYLDIAGGDYKILAFFPLYPLIVGIFSLFFPLVFSGFLASFLSLSAALYFLDLITREYFGKEMSGRVILLALFFPTAMFFPLIYTESLFLALILAFFYYARKQYWLKAAIIGFFAALTRNLGIFLFLAYFIFLFEDFYPLKLGKEKMLGLVKKKEFWYSFIIPLGLLLYCIYCYFQSGDFLAFYSSQKNWGGVRYFVWPWQMLQGFYNVVFTAKIWKNDLYDFFRMIIFEGGSFLILIAATIFWFFKKNWPWAAFCFLNVLLFSFMFPLYSVNRFVAVIFPIFIFLAIITRKRDWLFYSILSFSFVFFVFNVFLFSKGFWVG